MIPIGLKNDVNWNYGTVHWRLKRSQKATMFVVKIIYIYIYMCVCVCVCVFLINHTQFDIKI